MRYLPLIMLTIWAVVERNPHFIQQNKNGFPQTQTHDEKGKLTHTRHTDTIKNNDSDKDYFKNEAFQTANERTSDHNYIT